MENKGKKVIKFLGIVCLFLGVSFFVDYFIFNFEQFLLNDDEKGIIEINDYIVTKVDEKNCIKISLNDTYVNKLKIGYDAGMDVPVSIKYSELDYYDEKKNTEINDIFDNEVDAWVNNFSNEISEISILYDENLKLDINDIFIDNSFNFNAFRIFYVFSFLIVIWLLVQFYRSGSNSEQLYKYFIIVAFMIGVSFIILQPSSTFYSWDDQIHFLNSYELIGGNFQWSVGEFSMIYDDAVGRDSIDSIEEQINQAKYLNRTENVEYSTYGSHFITYNKVAYIPSAIGYHVCNKLGLPFVICFKVGKIMNLLAYVLIMGYAIKISKVGKRLLTVIALLPSIMFLASQYSYDPAVMSGVTLGFVILINWFVDKNSKVDFKSFLIFVLAMLYGCFPKAIYAPFLLLFLFVPRDRFRDKKQSIIVKSGVVLICLMLMYTFVLPTVTNTMAGDMRGGNTSVSEQLKLILNYPIGYVKILKDTMISNFIEQLFSSSTLTNFSYMGRMEGNSYYLLLIFMIFVVVTDVKEITLRRYQKVLFFLCCLGVILLIWTALYLAFTPVGLNTINGVQPRYFIPLLFPLFLCFQNKKIRVDIPDKVYNLAVILIPVVCFMIIVYNLVLLSFCI